MSSNVITGAILALLTFSAANTLHRHANQEHPICVVGGGLSGLEVATILTSKGYNVVVFEEKGRVGGKVETRRTEPNVSLIEAGPVAFTKSSSNIHQLLREFNLTDDVIPFRSESITGFEPFSGNIESLPGDSVEEQIALNEGLEAYKEYRSAYKTDFSYGYLNVSSELFLPFSTWLSQRNLTLISPLFILPVTVLGYGHLDDTPALYVLRLVDDEYLEGLRDGGHGPAYLTLRSGMSRLVQEMAVSLDVKLSQKVVSIRRRKKSYLTLGLANGLPSRKCDKVILAFPPLIKHLEGMVRGLSIEEIGVLDQVRVHKYAAGGVQVPPLDQDLYIEVFLEGKPKETPTLVTPQGRGEVIGMTRQSSGSSESVYSTYSWIRGQFRGGVSKSDVKKMSKELQNLISKVSVNGTMLFLQGTECFPHATTKFLQRGFYKKFDRIQGKGGLYYATTLLTLETMEKALEMAAGFCNKYF